MVPLTEEYLRNKFTNLYPVDPNENEGDVRLKVNINYVITDVDNITTSIVQPVTNRISFIKINGIYHLSIVKEINLNGPTVQTFDSSIDPTTVTKFKIDGISFDVAIDNNNNVNVNGYYLYIINSYSPQPISAPPLTILPICFPTGTPVLTNKGDVAIEKLNPDIHTIHGKRIVAITETIPTFKYIIRIEKDALEKNIPSKKTEISRDHKIFYKGKMIRSEDLVDNYDGVYRIKYHGETLYNVLMENHDTMIINNVICETLHPDNIMAKICSGKYNSQEKKELCDELNDILISNDLTACKKLYHRLLK